MDQKYPHKNPSQEEPAYFDGMHKRCTGWKTLTLWIYHNASRKLLRLATMEVKGETSENVALFWRLIKYWQRLKGNLVTNSIHVAGLLMRQEPTLVELVWYMVSRLCRKVFLADSITHNV